MRQHLNRKEKKSRQHVGLWHESCIVPEGGYESICADTPAYGPAAATGVLPVRARGRRAADRLAHRVVRRLSGERGGEARERKRAATALGRPSGRR